MEPFTASRRLIWPSIWLAKVGADESSKSAMNTFAPEFSALMIILRSTGPVISTRRSRRAAGIGRHHPVALANSRGVRAEIRQLASVVTGLAQLARGQQFLAASVEAAMQVGQEGQRVGRENGVVPRPRSAMDLCRVDEDAFLGDSHGESP